jgi:hypothetical protein
MTNRPAHLAEPNKVQILIKFWNSPQPEKQKSTRLFSPPHPFPAPSLDLHCNLMGLEHATTSIHIFLYTLTYEGKTREMTNAMSRIHKGPKLDFGLLKCQSLIA